jgi:hypothetical protein
MPQQKKPVSPEKYEKMLEYNRNYYASMSAEKKEEYLAYKRLYNYRNRDIRRERLKASKGQV